MHRMVDIEITVHRIVDIEITVHRIVDIENIVYRMVDIENSARRLSVLFLVHSISYEQSSPLGKPYSLPNTVLGRFLAFMITRFKPNYAF